MASSSPSSLFPLRTIEDVRRLFKAQLERDEVGTVSNVKATRRDHFDILTLVQFHFYLRNVRLRTVVVLVVVWESSLPHNFGAVTDGQGGGWWGDTPMHEVKPYVVTYAFFGFTIHHRGSKMTVARPCVSAV